MMELAALIMAIIGALAGTAALVNSARLYHKTTGYWVPWKP